MMMSNSDNAITQDVLTAGCIQMCSTADLNTNLKQAEKLIQEACRQGAELVVLPEYFPIMAHNHQAKLECQEPFGNGKIQAWIAQMATTYHCWLIAGSIPIRSDDEQRPHARCLVVNERGECQGYYDKLHMFDVEVNDATSQYCESRGTMPGSAPAIIDSPWGKIGLAICYDIRFPELFAYYRDQGVSFVALPSAFTVPTGAAHWQILLQARAVDSQCFVLAPAQTGQHQNGRETWGHSMMVDPWGDIVGELKQQVGVLVKQLELSKIEHVRSKMPLSKQAKVQLTSG